MRSAREISTISTGRLEHGSGRVRRSAHTGIYFRYTRVRVDLLHAYLSLGGGHTQIGNASFMAKKPLP